jgi:hypothetical protein
MPYGTSGRRPKPICPSCNRELVTDLPRAQFTCEHCGTELGYTLHIHPAILHMAFLLAVLTVYLRGLQGNSVVAGVLIFSPPSLMISALILSWFLPLRY